jgi:hypothetical protein
VVAGASIPRGNVIAGQTTLTRWVPVWGRAVRAAVTGGPRLFGGPDAYAWRLVATGGIPSAPHIRRSVVSSLASRPGARPHRGAHPRGRDRPPPRFPHAAQILQVTLKPPSASHTQHTASAVPDRNRLCHHQPRNSLWAVQCYAEVELPTFVDDQRLTRLRTESSVSPIRIGPRMRTRSWIMRPL